MEAREIGKSQEIFSRVPHMNRVTRAAPLKNIDLIPQRQAEVIYPLGYDHAQSPHA